MELPTRRDGPHRRFCSLDRRGGDVRSAPARIDAAPAGGHVARHLLPWSRVGLAVVVNSGALLFAADPVTLWFNTVFCAKMALIVVAGLNAAAFHAWTFRSVATWNQFVPAPRAAKVAAVISLSLWAAIAALGRFIAYIE